MSLISSYPNGFANGVALRGMTVLNTYSGNVFWVSSNGGSDGNKGTFDKPFATLAKAIDLATANNGDIILLKANHAESLSAELAIDKAGLSIIGLGHGTNRPTFTLTANVAISIEAADTYMENFVTTATAVAARHLWVQAAGATIVAYELQSGAQNSTQCVTIAATGTNCKLIGYRCLSQGVTGGTNALSIAGADGVEVSVDYIDGNFSTAAIGNTAEAENLRIYGAHPGAFIRNRNSADVIFTAAATTTGQVGPYLNCRIADDAANITEAIVGADMNFFDPIYIANADGERGLQWNGTASADA